MNTNNIHKSLTRTIMVLGGILTLSNQPSLAQPKVVYEIDPSDIKAVVRYMAGHAAPKVLGAKQSVEARLNALRKLPDSIRKGPIQNHTESLQNQHTELSKQFEFLSSAVGFSPLAPTNEPLSQPDLSGSAPIHHQHGLVSVTAGSPEDLRDDKTGDVDAGTGLDPKYPVSAPSIDPLQESPFFKFLQFVRAERSKGFTEAWEQLTIPQYPPQIPYASGDQIDDFMERYKTTWLITFLIKSNITNGFVFHINDYLKDLSDPEVIDPVNNPYGSPGYPLGAEKKEALNNLTAIFGPGSQLWDEKATELCDWLNDFRVWAEGILLAPFPADIDSKQVQLVALEKQSATELDQVISEPNSTQDSKSVQQLNQTLEELEALRTQIADVDALERVKQPLKRVKNWLDKIFADLRRYQKMT